MADGMARAARSVVGEEPRSFAARETDASVDGAATPSVIGEILHPAVFWTPESLVYSAWQEHYPFAFWLMATHQPRIFVELGTHYGGSYFAFCQTIDRLSLATTAYAVDTWQGDDHAGHYGEEVFGSVNAINSRRYSSFSTLLRSPFDEAAAYFLDGSIDLLHIDGLHTYEAVKHDFETWLPKLSDRAVVVFHDTNVRRDHFGVYRFFEELSATYPAFNFQHGHGLGVLAVGKEIGKPLRRFFEANRHPRDHRDIQLVFSRLGQNCAVLYNLGATQAQVQHLQAAEAAVRAHRDSVTAELEQTRHHADALNQRAAALEHEVQAGAGEREAIAAARREVEGRLEQLAAMLAQKTAEVDVALGQIQQLEARLREAQDYQQSIQAGLRQEIERLQGQVEATERQRLEMTDRQSRLEEDLARQREAERQAADQLAEARAQVTEARAQVTEGQARLAEGQAQLAEALPRVQLFAAQRSAATIPLRRRLWSRLSVGRANRLFDPVWYLAAYADVRAAGVDPWHHFVRFGVKEGRWPNPLFETGWYVREYPTWSDHHRDPLSHFWREGARLGCRPNPDFDPALYLARHPDVAAAKINPLLHYLCHGLEEGRSLRPD